MPARRRRSRPRRASSPGGSGRAGAARLQARRSSCAYRARRSARARGGAEPAPSAGRGVCTSVRCDSTGSRVRRRRTRSSAARAGKPAMREKLQNRREEVCSLGLQSYWGLAFICKGAEAFCRSLTMARTRLLGHQHEHRGRAPPGAVARHRPHAGHDPAARARGGPSGHDQHTLMVRRRVAAGAAVVLLIIIVLIINGCLKSQKQQSLKDYNHSVSEIARESDSQVSKPFFTALSGAAGKSAIDVQVQVNHLRVEAQKLASRAKDLSVPGEMKGAQQNLLLDDELPRRRDHEDRGAAAGGPRRAGQAGRPEDRRRHGDLPRLRRHLLAARRRR